VTQDILPQSSKDQQLHAYDDQCDDDDDDDDDSRRDIRSQHKELHNYHQHQHLLLPFVYVCQKPRLLGSTLLPLQEITHTPFATRPIDLRTDEEIRKQPLGPENLPASTAFYK